MHLCFEDYFLLKDTELPDKRMIFTHCSANLYIFSFMPPKRKPAPNSPNFYDGFLQLACIVLTASAYVGDFSIESPKMIWKRSCHPRTLPWDSRPQHEKTAKTPWALSNVANCHLIWGPLLSLKRSPS